MANQQNRSILVADDDAAIRGVLAELLHSEGFEVEQIDNGQSVLDRMADPALRPGLVIMDVRMPGKDGLGVLSESRKIPGTQLPVIIMTAYGSSNVAIQAMQLGAYDYITKPFDLEDVLLTVRRFFEHQALSDQVIELTTRLGERDPNETMIGSSQGMQDVYKTIGRVARSDATVLITGETGTGKELVASILHSNSNYSRGPLVKVNCAAIPETLLESELFGHEKGAFTGAITQRKGRFELANKGTIFLDEIGELSLATQKKLLRVLQEREFERVGGSVTVKVDLRVVAATNKILSQEVEAGRFREDLYYRLNVISIFLPPLRERKDDIQALVEHFLGKNRLSPSSPPSKISISALHTLMEYDWPGNVRELENILERATVMSQGGVIGEDHISFTGADQRRFVDIAQQVRRGTKLETLLADIERQAIIEALDESTGDQVEASTLLGIGIRSLRERMDRFGIGN